jgi:hypothetical protein
MKEDIVTEQIEMANNVFFQRVISEDYIKAICRRAVDMIPAIQESKTENRIGRVVLAMKPEEISEVVEEVQKSQGLVVMGNDFVRIAGTSIVIQAVVVETI